MAKKNITIFGYIKSQLTGKGIARLKVEAWDRDNRKDDLAGSGVTDSNGRFSITMQQIKGGWNLTDRKPDIFLKVYRGDKMLHNTFESLSWNLDRDKNDIEILIEGDTILLIGELLGFDNQIIEQIKTSKKITKPGEVKKLTALNKADWKSELTKSVNKINIAGKSIDKSLIDLHASSLAKKFEREFPTVAFSAQLAREKKRIFKNQVDINKFFAKYDNFDLQHTNIDLFLKDKKLITKKDEAMGEELKTMQRIFKLVPNYSKTNALLKENINSSQSIAAIGESRFVKEIAPKVGLSTKEAKDIFRKAKRTNTV